MRYFAVSFVSMSLFFISVPGSAEPNNPGLLAQLQIQYDQQQQQLRQMRGQIDQLNHQIKQLQRQSGYNALDDSSLKKSASQNEQKPATNTKTPPSQQSQYGASQMTMGSISETTPSPSQDAYDEARRLLDQRRFAEAEVALTQFIRSYTHDH